MTSYNYVQQAIADKKLVYVFKFTHDGKLYHNYRDDTDKNLPRPKEQYDRPVVWDKILQGGYFVIIDQGNITLINSKNKIEGKYSGNTKWPIAVGQFRMDKSADALVYYLNSFAGSYFIISPDEKYAELITNGSGLPIVGWVRGTLTLALI